MAIYALIQYANGTAKANLRAELQTRISSKLDQLSSSERVDAIKFVRVAIGEIKNGWINANPRYHKDTGRLVLEFDEPFMEKRAALKKFFNFWEQDPGVDITLTRNNETAAIWANFEQGDEV